MQNSYCKHMFQPAPQLNFPGQWSQTGRRRWQLFNRHFDDVFIYCHTTKNSKLAGCLQCRHCTPPRIAPEYANCVTLHRGSGLCAFHHPDVVVSCIVRFDFFFSRFLSPSVWSVSCSVCRVLLRWTEHCWLNQFVCRTQAVQDVDVDQKKL